MSGEINKMNSSVTEWSDLEANCRCQPLPAYIRGEDVQFLCLVDERVPHRAICIHTTIGIRKVAHGRDKALFIYSCLCKAAKRAMEGVGGDKRG